MFNPDSKLTEKEYQRHCGVKMKRCSKCRGMLRVDAFDIRCSKRDGTQVRPECKACRAAVNRAYLTKKKEQWDTNPELQVFRTRTGYRLEEM